MNVELQEMRKLFSTDIANNCKQIMTLKKKKNKGIIPTSSTIFSGLMALLFFVTTLQREITVSRGLPSVLR